ncbi:WD repeat-containing protein 55-like [Actinia tenebrosa]|uniref:WD repeat-containing protein 55-like n=1 Tax=Actinia tenebrosa TaxID=6105 RepID=A0A6P8H716_ACTTE|nr:WD repeat-containing protein 55-like [Actinia tenebrosa]
MAAVNLEDEDSLIPAEIKLPSQVFDVAFHPQRDVIAVGEIEGTVTIHSYSTSEQNKKLMELNHHKKACRAVAFSSDGTYLFTASKDKSLQAVDLNTGAVAHTRRKAHDSPINCLKLITDQLIATGDDDGCVKLWDRRTAQCSMEIKENEDFISDMECDSERKILLATSGDGSLSVFNVRRQKLENKSDNVETELLSVAIVKGGRKVVCGTGEGALNIFSWGEWGDFSDRFPGHPQSVDACVAISDNVVVTGSIDGIIRAVHILPNRLLGPVGEHADFPIERIRLSRDGNLIASCSHDQSVKFWNIEHLKTTSLAPGSKKKEAENVCGATSDNFFADL